MNRKLTALWALPLGAALGVACNLSQAVPPTPGTDDRVATAAAQTVVARTSPTLAASPTPPPQPTATETAVPTATLPPTAAPTATRTPIPCDWAAFVEDVSVPDGSQFHPGEDFTKTWRLRNVGGCTWEKGYSLVFSHGDRMDGPASVRLERSVVSGKTVDVSVRLEAPQSQGRHRGYWQLRSQAGVLFGIGPTADKPIWVDISVVRPKKTVYRFADDPCSAEWETQAGGLSCPGAAGDTAGFVVRVDSPQLEGGRTENEPALWTQPPASGDGWIRGEFPAFTVEKGDHFRALVACRAGATGCNVKFLLQYRVGDGEIRTLADWKENYQGEFRLVEVDLSSLAGKKVTFLLAVDSQGDPAGDEALWVQPRIVR